MNPTDQPGTHLIAFGGLLSPLWLHHMSDLSQTLLPILGLGWLLLQAGVYIYQTFWKKKP